MGNRKNSELSQEQIDAHRKSVQLSYRKRRANMTPEELQEWKSKRNKQASVWKKSSGYRQQRKLQFKKDCMAYKGGKCERCNLVDIPQVFDFHHKNPSEKDFTINSKRHSYGLNDLIRTELDKCELLCANCHRRTHAEMNMGD